MEPMRARPVPFCRHSFLPEPDTSWRVLVFAFPPRRTACECRTASYSRSLLSGAPKTTSDNSSEPTTALFKSTTSTLGMLLPLGPSHQHIAAIGTRDRSLDHQHVVFSHHFHYFQIPDGHLLVARMAGHAGSG